MGGLGLRPDQVNNIVNTIFIANRKNPRAEDRNNSLKTTDGVKNRLRDEFVSSSQLKRLLNNPGDHVALTLADPSHPGAAVQLSEEVTYELDRADGATDGWIRLQDRSWAAELLREYTGTKREGYISRDALKWALESGRLCLGEGGKLLTPDEAKAHGDLILAVHEDKDGAKLALFQGSSRMRIQPYPYPTTDRPTPPSVDTRPAPPPIYSRPTPPPIDDRPVPPPINDRPVPPPIDDRPAPPPISYRSPARIADEFQVAKADLQRTYQSTSMTASERDQIERDLVDQAVRDLLATQTSPYSDRKAALTGLYQASSLDATQRDAIDRQLVAQEVDRIAWMRGPSLGEKLQLLQNLYQASPMSATELEDAKRRVEQAYYSR